MECHRCEHREAVEAGVYARMAFEATPCAKCELKQNSEHTIAYDTERETAADRGPQTTDREAEGEMLPIAVMQRLVAALLLMPRDIRDAVCWRYAGFKYRDVATVQNVSTAAVEARHKRALRRWPILQALFREKMVKQARRQKSGCRRGRYGVVRRTGDGRENAGNKDLCGTEAGGAADSGMDSRCNARQTGATEADSGGIAAAKTGKPRRERRC